MKEREHQRADWIGRSAQELEQHPYFSKLKLRKEHGPKESMRLTYIDGTPVQTDARCQSLGGCAGTENWCENIFILSHDKIVQYEQLGPCPFSEKMSP